MPHSRYYHPDYRQAEVSGIVQALDRGQSVSVIGAPSVGKSNLLQFLDQERLAASDPNSPWQRYAPLSATQGPVVAISIDPNALLPALPQSKDDIAAQAWPGFELLIHRTTITPQLYPAYHPPSGESDDPVLVERIARLQERFENAHPDVTDFEDRLHAHLALRHLERLLDAALASHAQQGRPIRIAYILDEFERFLSTMPNYFFVALRSIRDRFKYRVMFVTFTRNSLPYLIGPRMAAVEPFFELFHDTTIYLGPFGDDDAWRMIEQLEQRSVSKDDYALGLVIRATGGFAGLLRAGFQHAEALGQIRAGEYKQAVALAAKRLCAEDNVRAECATLLRGLNQDEIGTLFGAATGQNDLPPAVVRELVQKSLLLEEAGGSGLRVMPPVLAAYIQSQPAPPPANSPPQPVTLPEA